MGGPLRARRPARRGPSALDPADLAALGAGVAATLADLHDLGVVHGRLTAAHVLLGPGGRPVLCGFGSSQAGATPEDDVAALGLLLSSLAGVDGEGEPIPERRWHRRRPWDGWAKRALLTLADQAMAEPPTRRPSARRLAAALRELAPTPDDERDERDEPDRPRAAAVPAVPRVRPRSAALAALGIAVLVVGVRTRAPEAPTERPTTPDEAGVAAAPPPPAAPCGPPDGVDLDADGCREPVVVHGSIVEVGDVAFEVGRPDDRIEVGDWDCDGQATVALLRPSTGGVFLFRGWDRTDAVTVAPAATVPGGRDLVAGARADGCAGLGVRTDAGEVVEVIRAGSGSS